MIEREGDVSWNKIIAVYYHGPGISLALGNDVGLFPHLIDRTISKISRIEQYDDAGQMSYVPYIRIYVGGKVWKEIPKHAVTVEYELQGHD